MDSKNLPNQKLDFKKLGFQKSCSLKKKIRENPMKGGGEK